MKLFVLSVMLCAMVAGSSAQTTTTKSPNIARIQQAVGSILGQMSIIPSSVRQVIAGTDAQNNTNKALAAITALQSQYTYFSSSYTSAVPADRRTDVTNAINNFRSTVSNLEASLKQVPVNTSTLSSNLSALETAFMMLGSIAYTL